MNNFSIRTARRSDRTPIRKLIWKVRINVFGLNWRNFLVATDGGGRLIGCGQLKPHGRRTIELASIAVDERVRGQGIARALIETLLTRAPRPLYLICLPGMTGLYERFGFSRAPGEGLPRHFRIVARVSVFARHFHRSHAPVIMRLD